MLSTAEIVDTQALRVREEERFSPNFWNWTASLSTVDVLNVCSIHYYQAAGIQHWWALYKHLPHGLCALDFIWIFGDSWNAWSSALVQVRSQLRMKINRQTNMGAAVVISCYRLPDQEVSEIFFKKLEVASFS